MNRKRKTWLLLVLAVILMVPGYGIRPEAAIKSRSEYLLPNSSEQYLGWEDVKDLTAPQLRIARNEIYARHGRQFLSADLKMYFESRSWYKGTVKPEAFDDGALNDVEASNVRYLKSLEPIEGKSGLPEAPTKALIDAYGYRNGYSVLAFTLRSGTLVDKGDYYIVDAQYFQGIEVPGDMKVGDKVTVTVDETTGKTWELVRKEDGIYPTDDPSHQMYYYPNEDGSPVVLYEASDDRVDKLIYEGKLYIRKDATDEVNVMKSSKRFDPKEIDDYDSWYNGVYFDTKGYAKRLVFYGD